MMRTYDPCSFHVYRPLAFETLGPSSGPSYWSNGEGPQEALERMSVAGSFIELLAKEITVIFFLLCFGGNQLTWIVSRTARCLRATTKRSATTHDQSQFFRLIHTAKPCVICATIRKLYVPPKFQLSFRSGPLVSSDFASLLYGEIGYQSTTVLAELKLCTFMKDHYCNNVVPLSACSLMMRMLTKMSPLVQLPVDHGPDPIKLPTRRMCQPRTSYHANHQSAFRSTFGPFTRDQLRDLLDYGWLGV
ncbi:hypothetical protein BDR06DRAFT_458948 [Suillus hirtellus]|nr:hypothetical protein BDR06DRAFT_458948 [Suillus hirtellus]